MEIKKGILFMHGGDYNPDQWDDFKSIVDEDIMKMRQVGINTATVGVFSWSQLEKLEGIYDFNWLDYLFEQFEYYDMNIILATPSAAMPAWMAAKYPEILRTPYTKVRNEWESRVNYCPSSLIYREKCAMIDEQLAKRYGTRKALVMWHINNEISGACYCKNCEQRFRQWLKKKYHTLEQLNAAWWTSFWSHAFTDWEEVGFPGYINESLDNTLKGQLLDTKRFFSYIMADHYKAEVDVIKKYSDKPVTTNTWRLFGNMKFRDFEPYMDVAAIDLYPQYHDQPGDDKLSSVYGFACDYYRNIKNGKPFILMETTPESALMFSACKLKRPKVHNLFCMQTIAHGSDGINYFQWRKGRGGCEQLHGAVIDHPNSMDTKTVSEVKAVSANLQQLRLRMRNCSK